MKGLKKVALASAIAAVSAGAQAELKALDDAAMGELTGQAGLTIDLETKYTIGEFMYKDTDGNASVFFKGMSLGANTNDAGGANAGTGALGFVDNIRIKLDVAGAGESLDYGMSRVRDLAALAAAGAQSQGAAADAALFGAAAAGSTSISDVATAVGLAANATGFDTNGVATTALTIGDEKVYDDGDLVIHVSFKDAWQKTGGLSNQLAAGVFGNTNFSDTLAGGLKSVDFNFSIDAIGLAASNVEAGDTITRDLMGHTASGLDNDGADTTVLISDLSVNGFLGTLDIHIENDGNGFNLFAGVDTNGAPVFIPTVGAADSVINWDSYINITDLDVYLDIAGVQVSDMKINNVRGDVTDLDGNFALGFAHSKRQIYAVRNTAGLDSAAVGAALVGSGAGIGTGILDVLNTYGQDGVAINTTFKGDQEIGALSFGDTGTSIGELYWTDIERTTNWTISAH